MLAFLYLTYSIMISSSIHVAANDRMSLDFVFFEMKLAMWSRMTSNSKSSCLYFPSTGITLMQCYSKWDFILFMGECYYSLCSFFYSSGDRHFSCFHFWLLWEVEQWTWTCSNIHTPSWWTSEIYDSSIFNILTNINTIFNYGFKFTFWPVVWKNLFSQHLDLSSTVFWKNSYF